jgi:hypothetical protein
MGLVVENNLKARKNKIQCRGCCITLNRWYNEEKTRFFIADFRFHSNGNYPSCGNDILVM